MNFVQQTIFLIKLEISLAKTEIHSRAGNLYDWLWWRYMPGQSITIKWPCGEVTIDDSMPEYDWTMGAKRYSFYSADPNDHYRPWLEKYAGRQHWDWNWRIAPKHSMWIGNVPRDVNDELEIKFRKGKEKYATLALLQWNQ